MTLWMSGICSSPMPWMLCSPEPLQNMVEHSTAFTATIFVLYSFLSRSPAAIVPAEPVAETKAAGG